MAFKLKGIPMRRFQLQLRSQQRLEDQVLQNVSVLAERMTVIKAPPITASHVPKTLSDISTQHLMRSESFETCLKLKLKTFVLYIYMMNQLMNTSVRTERDDSLLGHTQQSLSSHRAVGMLGFGLQVSWRVAFKISEEKRSLQDKVRLS